jgi:quercetin dioxygenase-like cupin family protein
MRILVVLSLLGLLASDVLAQSSDPPSVFLLKELQEDRSEVRMLTSQFAPNTASPWHIHPAAVAIYVESGTGVWEIEGHPPRTVLAGEGLLEPANKRSRVSNKNPTKVLKLISFQISDPARPFAIQYK